ncbi:MAG TPA: YhjD/YihY/BrkB family envelope integrity protein [Nocardioides sp.]|uniref:YihY/virulence factor BrkB family protein n=1 Tax=Nocardioides sp. TaxID=35761 RepID=UPI002CE48EE4|nr:YhjD/YihY/BrkB family envelope integrity protein [Nocardioides sp.]HQR28181.1 YhjD/YihY/BrkB family envelope integrity protein [Nocardioides sp.]
MPDLSSARDRAQRTFATARRRSGLLDHGLRTQEQYSAVQGSMHAGAITYYGVLSFFPLLALSFFVVGYLARVFPNAEQALETAVEQLFPGVFGGGADQLSLADLERLAGTLGLVGLLGALYTGLGWLSATRSALLAVFDLPSEEYPSFLLGKARDLAALVSLGTLLLLSVAVSGFVSHYARQLLEWVGLGTDLGFALTLLSVVLGVASAVLLFWLMFTLLARPHAPRRSLWLGALLGAVAFEALKRLASYLLTFTTQAPAFQLFGITLILIVWISYFSRITLYAAAWAHTRRPVAV